MLTIQQGLIRNDLPKCRYFPETGVDPLWGNLRRKVARTPEKSFKTFSPLSFFRIEQKACHFVVEKLNYLISRTFFRFVVHGAPIFIGRVWRNVDTSYTMWIP